MGAICPKEKPAKGGPRLTREVKRFFAKEKPRHNAVCNSSFELVRNRRNPPDCFRLPVKACRPQPELRFHSYLGLRFKEFVSEHEHGRVKWFNFTSKDRSASLLLSRFQAPFTPVVCSQILLRSSKKPDSFRARWETALNLYLNQPDEKQALVLATFKVVPTGVFRRPGDHLHPARWGKHRIHILGLAVSVLR